MCDKTYDGVYPLFFTASLWHWSTVSAIPIMSLIWWGHKPICRDANRLEWNNKNMSDSL